MKMDDEGSGPKEMPKPKGLLALIAKPKEESEDPARMAANGIMDAVKAGDADMLADALRTFMDSCD